MIDLEGIIDKINEAENISIVYYSKKPSTVAGAYLLAKIHKVSKIIGWSGRNLRKGHWNKINPKVKNADLVIFLGIRSLYPRPSYNYIQIRDTINLNLFYHPNLPIYIANKKNLPDCPYCKTTSHAHACYEIAKEFNIGLTPDIALKLMLGDWGENQELPQTSFQKEMAEYLGLKDLALNVMRSLGDYQILNVKPLIYVDLPEKFGFEYKLSEEKGNVHKVENRFPIDKLIEESRKGIENFLLDDLELPEEYLYFPKIGQNTLIEEYYNSFLNGDKMHEKIEKEINETKFAYLNNPLRFKRIKDVNVFTLYAIHGDAFNFTYILMFFPKNSLFITSKLHRKGIYSKSYLHAGLIAAISGPKKCHGISGYGYGGKVKGFYFNKGYYFLPIICTIENLLEEENNHRVSSPKVYSLDKAVYSAFYGKETTIEIDGNKHTFRPPWENLR